MAEYVNYLRVFDAGRGTELLGAIQDDTAGLGSVDLNRITPMPVWMREEAGRRYGAQAGQEKTAGWTGGRQTGERGGTLKAQASAAAYDGGDPILFYTRTPVCRC